jgi:hypothetical protein
MNMVLQVDKAGTPQDWLTLEGAAKVICSGHMAWSLGDPIATLRGGRSRLTGEVSRLAIPAIVATDGMANFNLADCVPPLTNHNRKLFTRDRHLCAYCGEQFDAGLLTREHIMPVSRGGKDVWTNVVTACKACNNRKSARTPEEAHMPLLYLPYAPNWFEDFVLQRGGKRILADQMEFLIHRVAEKSRLRVAH